MGKPRPPLDAVCFAVVVAKQAFRSAWWPTCRARIVSGSSKEKKKNLREQQREKEELKHDTVKKTYGHFRPEQKA
jgi:hypothetical protein